jgi:hypothetical protein
MVAIIAMSLGFVMFVAAQKLSTFEAASVGVVTLVSSVSLALMRSGGGGGDGGGSGSSPVTP